ncbi:hypothetical protein [Clostridium kluyveri]|uniref:hypothetical protein n=1 Tax=Clostridium kluyveri TaxID=1534 RepID=UPI002246D1D0|nr:hypothetical protein [Clostridium kluyveri]UZQ48850.1 hypothetical protein OP486_12750 [Clostridium kluyveri]
MLEDNLPGYKLIHKFDPKGKIFVFKLSKYDCYRLGSGKCSLDTEDGKNIKSVSYDTYREYDLSYCPSLVNSLRQYGVKNEIYSVRVTKNSCDHYSITDGQHRLCSAAHANIKLDVYVQEYDGECYICYWKKKSIKFRIKDFLGKNDIFLRKL